MRNETGWVLCPVEHEAATDTEAAKHNDTGQYGCDVVMRPHGATWRVAKRDPGECCRPIRSKRQSRNDLGRCSQEQVIFRKCKNWCKHKALLRGKSQVFDSVLEDRNVFHSINMKQLARQNTTKMSTAMKVLSSAHTLQTSTKSSWFRQNGHISLAAVEQRWQGQVACDRNQHRTYSSRTDTPSV